MRPHEVLVALAMTAAACTADATPPAATSAPPSSPTETTESVSFGSARGPLIAFHSDPGGRDDTSVMTPDGREPVAVTDGIETVAEPLWSPDGTRLVVGCCTGVHGKLLLLDGPGADPIELAPDVDEATAPAWSPDGETIAFESLTDSSVYVVDVGGAELGTPVRLVAGAEPSWSPDGSRLAFFAGVDGNLDIYSMASDGTDVVRLTDDPAADHSPLWSPAGDQIAFVSERGGDQDIYVMASDGTSETDVSSDGVTDDFPAWSPDGRRIAFVAFLHGADPFTIRQGDAEIFVMRPDGTDQRRLRGLTGVANDCCPTWRPG